MPEDGIEGLAKQLTDHQLNYERRHAELEQRVMRLETLICSLATREDLANFRLSVATLQETIKQFETISGSMATKKDVEWIKGFVEKATAALVSLLLMLGGLVISHVFAGKP